LLPRTRVYVLLGLMAVVGMGIILFASHAAMQSK